VGGNEMHMVGGNEAHTVTGDVVQNFGDTTAHYASLKWTIPGGAVITTPEFKVKTGNFLDTYVKKNTVGIQSGSVSAISISAGGIVVKNAGLMSVQYGVDTKKVALTHKVGGLSLDSLGVIVKTCGIFVVK